MSEDINDILNEIEELRKKKEDKVEEASSSITPSYT
jgi:hypothetical protein